MVVMTCNDKNKFLFDCVPIASRIHKFSNCDLVISDYKYIELIASIAS
jgi:hypothetical protein